MAEFVQQAPSYDGIIWEYRAGNITFVAKAYAFSQYRLQVWCDMPGYTYPDILSPEC